ncbi:hypothetical protein [Streptomyces sp. NPDC048057]|uniref:hypothetical protein n=1 Tax=Streptomyces sp. NPDC048057 TaxID=3155628 RepID=UPI0033EE578C
MRRFGCLISPVAGLLTTFVGVFLIARLWDACDAGINDSANSYGLVPYAALLLLVTTAWWAITIGAVSPRSPVLALSGALLGSLLLLWAFVAVLYRSGEYLSVQCWPGRDPSWWPAWIPI